MRVAVTVELNHLEAYDGMCWTVKCPAAKAISEICGGSPVQVRAVNFTIDLKDRTKWITLPLPEEMILWTGLLDSLILNMQVEGIMEMFPRTFYLEIPEQYIFQPEENHVVALPKKRFDDPWRPRPRKEARPDGR